MPRRAGIGIVGRHRDRRRTVRLSIAARPAKERSEQLARQPQDECPDGYDERRTEQHPAHGVDITRDIGSECGHGDEKNGGDDVNGKPSLNMSDGTKPDRAARALPYGGQHGQLGSQASTRPLSAASAA